MDSRKPENPRFFDPKTRIPNSRDFDISDPKTRTRDFYKPDPMFIVERRSVTTLVPIKVIVDPNQFY
jgi:hypothetical protein